jgi:aminopeptidase N
MKFSTLISIALTVTAPGITMAAAADRIVLPDNVIPESYELSVIPDAAAMTFTGSVRIDVDVKKSTKEIKLNAADLVFKRVALTDIAATPTISFDTEQEVATLTFPAIISAGHHVLAIDYTGKINQHPAGLFALDYDTATGKKRALFTQFENSDARRFLPSWDEPGYKTTFALTVTVPADQMAISNTPIDSTEPLPGGLARVHFAPSPKMSSYLLFFGVGDFERISRKVNGVDVGVVVKRGDTDKAQFALDAASRILPYYEDYFGVKYPLPKLDLIAGPGQSQTFGAMENWGAIFYFEYDLLIDSKLSTQEDQRRVFIVVAHEMAHQWFGDLVTMAWWDDLWLNEGFASWMEFKATDHFHPEWKVWLDALSSKEEAMGVDSRGGTHPIIQPIRDVLQADQAFDTITYSKGQAVIRMLEEYVGADTFRAGVRSYIKAHAYGNTVTDDLWRELDKAAGARITDVAHDFTLQAGIPLIHATATGNSVHLTQDRFAVDDAGKVPTSWRVPVTEKEEGGSGHWQGLVSRDKPTDVPVTKGATPMVNAGQAGYFRTLYDPATFANITAGFADLAPADQLGLLNDSRALGYSGYEPLSDFLQLTSKASPSLDPVVLDTIASRLQAINLLYEGLPGQAAFQAYGRRVLEPAFASVGWTAKPGEAQNVTLLRSSLLGTLSDLNDTAVIAEARIRFAAYLKDPTTLSGDLRRNVLAIVAKHADAATWEQLLTLAKTAKSSLESARLYGLLASVHDRDLANRALTLSMATDVPVTTRPTLVRVVSVYYPDMAMDFFMAHAGVFDSILEPTSRARFAPSLAGRANDLSMIPKLRAYAAAHIPESARGDELKAEAVITFKAKVRTERLPEVDKWLAEQLR